MSNAADEADNQQPEFIRLMDASGTTVLDSVATEYEDSFCIETFGDLIKAAEEAEPVGTKCFIIARVQTWDHKQPDRAFYSYYHAHHLNKLLFQTQLYLDKKLIHRLHVLNPLTNTDIIGNVLYFIVRKKTRVSVDGLGELVASGESVPLADNSGIVKSVSTQPAGSDSVNDNDQSAFGTLSSSKSQETIKPGKLQVITDLTVQPNQQSPLCSPSVTKIPHLTDPVLLNRVIHNNQPSGASSPLKSPVRRFEVIPEGKEEASDDSSTPLTPRSQATIRPLDVQKANTANDGWTITAPVSSQMEESEAEQQISACPKSKQKSKHLLNRLQIPSNSADHSKEDAAHTLSVNNQIPTTPRSPQPLSPAPAGVVSQHGTPLTPLQVMSIVPPSARSRRRSLSFMNALTTAGVRASMNEWIQMVQQDRLQSARPSPIKSAANGAEWDNYDSVKPFSNQSVAKSPSRADADGKFKVYYDAWLFATDNDFLESSKIRMVFKDNAVNPADTKLFEMTPYLGDTATNARSRNSASTQNILENCVLCCFPTEDQLRTRPYSAQIVHHVRCYLLVMMIVAVIAVVIYLIAVR